MERLARRNYHRHFIAGHYRDFLRDGLSCSSEWTRLEAQRCRTGNHASRYSQNGRLHAARSSQSYCLQPPNGIHGHVHKRIVLNLERCSRFTGVAVDRPKTASDSNQQERRDDFSHSVPTGLTADRARTFHFTPEAVPIRPTRCSRRSGLQLSVLRLSPVPRGAQRGLSHHSARPQAWCD